MLSGLTSREAGSQCLDGLETGKQISTLANARLDGGLHGLVLDGSVENAFLNFGRNVVKRVPGQNSQRQDSQAKEEEGFHCDKAKK